MDSSRGPLTAGGSRSLRRLLPALVALAFVLSTIPTFFSIYRDAAFHSTPFDDYAPSLLAMVGERGTERLPLLGDPPARIPTALQDAPMGYRVLSVAAAVPFYYALPAYSFSNLPYDDPQYLRATAALAMVAYLAILAAVLVVYLIARRRLRCSQAASLLTGMLAYAMFAFLSTLGVDALAVLVIAVLVYFIDRPSVFVPLVLVGALTNEKIPIVFAVVFGVRLLAWLLGGRRGSYRYWLQTASSAGSVAIYFAMRAALQLPGWENQTDPSTWLSGASKTLAQTASLKGLVLNGIPIGVVALLAIVAVAVWARQRSSDLYFSPLDVSAALALVVIGTAIGMEFTVGRLVMHAFPIYLPLAAIAIDAALVRPAASSEALEVAPAGGNRA